MDAWSVSKVPQKTATLVHIPIEVQIVNGRNAPAIAVGIVNMFDIM
jgi:hypothetical protein